MVPYKCARNKTSFLTILFLLCFLYWGYLILASQMEIRFDAVGYEALGRLMYKEGWSSFFKTGPNRDILYHLLIAVSFSLANFFSMSYQYIQKILQCGLLFLSQLLVLFLMRKLKINPLGQATTILYMGFSPSLVNSAMSLFGEIISYPFILLSVISMAISWNQLQKAPSLLKVVLLAFFTASSFLLAIFSRAILLFTVQTCFVVSVIVGFYFLLKEKLIKNFIIYVILVGAIFYSVILSFQSVNKFYNGRYVFAEISPHLHSEDVFYGNAAKRVKPLTLSIFLAHITSIPGHGFCRFFFTEEECAYCEFQTADKIYNVELPKLLEKIPSENRKSEVWKMSGKLILQNPIQYILLTLFEAARMFFWESTHVGFVTYPVWLQNLYNSNLFSDGLRLAMAILTLFALASVALRTYSKIKYLIHSSPESEEVCFYFFILLMVGCYIATYSMFSILNRYALPIVSLYLVCIVSYLNNAAKKSKQSA